MKTLFVFLTAKPLHGGFIAASSGAFGLLMAQWTPYLAFGAALFGFAVGGLTLVLKVRQVWFTAKHDFNKWREGRKHKKQPPLSAS